MLGWLVIAATLASLAYLFLDVGQLLGSYLTSEIERATARARADRRRHEILEARAARSRYRAERSAHLRALGKL